MKSLQQLLTFEAVMSRTALEKNAARLAGNVFFGFEAEMVIAPDSELYEESEASYIDTDDIDSLEEIQQYFQWSRNDDAAFHRAYSAWFDDRVDTIVDKEWHKVVQYNDHSDPEEAENDARNEVYDDIKRHPKAYDLSENDYIKDETATKIIAEMGLEPIHGWHDDEHDSVYTEPVENTSTHLVRLNAAKSLKEELNVDVRVLRAYHETPKSKSRWYIEPDTTIKPTEGEGGIGIEIVSPPYPLQEGLVQLEKLFAWMYKHAYTNDTTGLHVNISFSNHPKIDPLKLAIFMGEEHVLKQFGRVNNTYASHHLRYLMAHLLTGKFTTDVEEFIRTSGDLMRKERYFSFNLSHYEKDGYIEFRVTGNKNYEHRYGDVRNAVLRFVNVLSIAADPEAHRQEYLKKVALLIQRSLEGEHLPKGDLEATDYTKSLSRLLRYDQMAATWLNNAPKNWTTNKEFAKDQVENALSRIANILRERNLQPTFAERKAFRDLIKQYQIPMPNPVDFQLQTIFKYAGIIK